MSLSETLLKWRPRKFFSHLSKGFLSLNHMWGQMSRDSETLNKWLRPTATSELWRHRARQRAGPHLLRSQEATNSRCHQPVSFVESEKNSSATLRNLIYIMLSIVWCWPIVTHVDRSSRFPPSILTWSRSVWRRRDRSNASVAVSLSQWLSMLNTRQLRHAYQRNQHPRLIVALCATKTSDQASGDGDSISCLKSVLTMRETILKASYWIPMVLQKIRD